MRTGIFLLLFAIGVVSLYLKIAYGAVRVSLFILLAVVVVTSAYLRIYYGGWFLILFGVPTLAIFGAHIYFNLQAIFLSDAITRGLIHSIVVSNLIFLGSILLQADDGEVPYLIIEGIFNRNLPGWAGRLGGLVESYPLWNSLVFLPNLLAWIDLKRS